MNGFINVEGKGTGGDGHEQDKQKLSFGTLSARGWAMQTLSYNELFSNLKKEIRKGNWRKLSRLEKALYRAAMAYTKPKPKKGEKARNIVNKMVADKLLALIKKLSETSGMRVCKRGFKKAVELLQKSEVFVWAPSLRYWLKDPDYIFWLGRR